MLVVEIRAKVFHKVVRCSGFVNKNNENVCTIPKNRIGFFAILSFFITFAVQSYL
jgi:hypothetical protein